MHVWTLHASLLTTGNYLQVHMRKRRVKSEETLVFPPASFVDVIVKEEKLWECGYVFLHASMWEHIAAAVQSITVCVYGI